MYHIVADSGCDLFALGDASFKTVPMLISSDDKTFLDDETLDTAQMIEYFLNHKGRSFTACPPMSAWHDAFLAADGTVPDEVYVVTLTSALSGTYNSAMLARDMFLEQNPGVKMLVVDSLSVGPEMWLILEEIDRLKRAGATFEEVSAAMPAYVKKARLFFAFQSLHNLAENGRVSKLAAGAAGILGITVFGTASDEGTIEPLGKARGSKRVVEAILNQMEAAGFAQGKVRISQTENEPLARLAQTAISERWPDADVAVTAVRGLCSFYCERGGIVVACETA